MSLSRLRRFDFVKRIFDVLVSGLGLIVLAPLLVSITVLVAGNLGRPVFFVQERPGLGGRVFRLYKFRSMRNPDPARGLLTDEQRLTRFGGALRSTSLDELPSLWNVLRGDMSLVGPRPLRVHYLDRYTPRQRRRHEVRPGLTGLAQIAGRNLVDWPSRLELDVEYVEGRSMRRDVTILLKTVKLVFSRTGISAPAHATSPEFRGQSQGHDGGAP